jgi:hypothetical protein
MYIDSLTITALVIFLVSLVLVIRFCVFGLCGGPCHSDLESPEL